MRLLGKVTDFPEKMSGKRGKKGKGAKPQVDLSFLQDIFSEDSPFKVLIFQEDTLFEEIILNIVAINYDTYERTFEYFEYLIEGETFARKKEETEELFPSKQIASLLKHASDDFGAVLFRILAVLNFLQSDDLDFPSFCATHNVCFLIYSTY